MVERRAIAVHGIVQGVGFRPFVYGLASVLELRGFVRNEAGNVWIEVEGEPSALDRFVSALSTRPPPLARIERIDSRSLPLRGESRFQIEHSNGDARGAVFISPDVATCDACLAELFDPNDRRYLYPFTNCTNCGPRLTIVTGAPYDRERTTMTGFAMCPACRAEYEDPTDRRFHAQPVACSVCGPVLCLLTGDGQRVEGSEALDRFVEAIRDGGIGAIKGLGGYHLTCDARDGTAVARLRQRKHRDEKPFAVMVPGVTAAEALCEIGAAERELLLSPSRPIVLLRKCRLNDPAHELAAEVAPGNPFLGVMLPYTPLHHLLLHARGDVPLVMTSGNRSDEPIAYEDDEALQRLSGIADLFLAHNRPIHVRCDDSVTRVVDGKELLVRRSRGYAPQPAALSNTCPAPILAVGGQLKNTFALGREHHGFLSHHMGDLDHFEAYRAFERDVALYEELFAIRPQWIAHDMHPDYASTRYAQRRAAEEDLHLIGVQHHHAHMASCMAEHGLDEPVIGVTFDGTGFGTDGAIWGGEFLVGDYSGFRRAAHLRYVGMPGGERAIREPWRMALAHLIDAGYEPDLLESRLPPAALRAVTQMVWRRFNTPLTSSAGRLFDAVASLAGVRDRVSYEGQAAIELEWLAKESPAAEVPGEAYPFDLHEVPGQESSQTSWIADTRPLILGVVHDVEAHQDATRIAWRFHATMVELIATVCGRLREASGIDAVVMSGGVFMNALLTHQASQRLHGQEFRVYRHHRVPPNDGGLSLGQLAIASVAARQPAPAEAR